VRILTHLKDGLETLNLKEFFTSSRSSPKIPIIKFRKFTRLISFFLSSFSPSIRSQRKWQYEHDLQQEIEAGHYDKPDVAWLAQVKECDPDECTFTRRID